MTQDQLILFKELIKETVKSAVREIVKEEMSMTIKKDLKEVKQLLAKSIKEGRENNSKVQYIERQSGNPEDFRTKLREAVGSDFRPAKSKPIMPTISPEAGLQISSNGTLPDIDAPIPFIDKSSIMWKDMKEKIG
jgi:hypothetical protein